MGWPFPSAQAKTLEREPRMRVHLRRRALLVLLVAAVLLGAALDVRIIEPRIHVRWRDDVTDGRRIELERRYELHTGERVEDTTWRYELLNRSRENVGALVGDSAVADTAYIDRPTLAVPEREIRISAGRLLALAGPAPRQLVQIQSVLLIVCGTGLLWAATLADDRRRRMIAAAIVLGVGVGAFGRPLHQEIRMGDAETYTRDRTGFESYTGVREIRFEAHLSHAILGRLDALLGRTADSPGRAFRLLMHAATAWFLLMALAVGIVEAWSPAAVRYLGLVVIGPSALMYFGYRELGHLSLNVATFPLLMRGLRHASPHLEASGALAGLSGALHGFGLLSVAGALLTALAARIRLADRIRAAARFCAWSVAAYVGWVALYLIVLKLPLVAGHADTIPMRPLFVDTITDRVNAAILTPRGLRDVIATGLVAGVPLIAIAASLWRRLPAETRAALFYAVPSAIFLVLFWPIQGLAVEMDLVFAAFPAFYALAWVCAQDHRRAVAAAAFLAGAHLVFWRIVFDSAFVNSRI
jgi:hypothetical protein